MSARIIPPMDLDVEHALLGGALQLDGGREILDLLAASVHVSDFYTEAHRTIFARMLALHREGGAVDQFTLTSALREHGELDAVGGPSKIMQLFEDGVLAIPANVPAYIAQVLEYSRKRSLVALGQRIVQHANNGTRSAAVLDDIGATVESLRARVARQRPDEAPSELTRLLAHRFVARPGIIARGVLPRGGLLLVGGAPKVGKSLLLDNLCLQRARGRPWLGFSTDPGVTLIVQSEMQPQAVAERFGTMLRHDPEPFPEGRVHIKSRRGVMLDEPAGLAEIVAWIEETGADLVRIDPLARHMRGDENSNRDMGTVVAAVDSLIERYGVSVVIAHHPTKPSKDESRTGGMRLRGASALFAAADSVIMMDRTDDGFTLTFDLRHAAVPVPMRLTRTEDLWLVAAGHDPELLAVARLTSTAPLTYRVLVGAAGADLKISTATAKRRIAAAVTAGLLAKDADGLYRIGSAVSQAHEVSSDA